MTTIVLLHGLWVTPRSWEAWVPYLRSAGHIVVTPAYPGFEVEVEALRAHPGPIVTATVTDTLAHLEKLIVGLPERPVLVGHGFGGTLVQLLLDRGHGSVGVVVGSMPPRGIAVNPPSRIRSLMPFLNDPAHRDRAVGFTAEQWHYAFANTLSESESEAAYDRYAIPAPGSWFWTRRRVPSFTPGHQETAVDFRRPVRAPLLFIAGGKDQLVPPALARANARRYTATQTVTDYLEVDDLSHLALAEPGWERVADTALDWARRHAC